MRLQIVRSHNEMSGTKKMAEMSFTRFGDAINV